MRSGFLYVSYLTVFFTWQDKPEMAPIGRWYAWKACDGVVTASTEVVRDSVICSRTCGIRMPPLVSLPSRWHLWYRLEMIKYSLLSKRQHTGKADRLFCESRSMFSLDDPSTWAETSAIDAELDEVRSAFRTKPYPTLTLDCLAAHPGGSLTTVYTRRSRCSRHSQGVEGHGRI